MTMMERLEEVLPFGVTLWKEPVTGVIVVEWTCRKLYSGCDGALTNGRHGFRALINSEEDAEESIAEVVEAIQETTEEHGEVYVEHE